MFDWGIYKSREFDIPIVCIGNITVGGTGKTPTTEYLVELLGRKYCVAVLSRGYKRRTKGFLMAASNSSFKRIGDEPKQIKLKFPTVPVAVCEKRCEGIDKLRKIHPEVNLIILDDAFQHRHVDPWVNLVLMDYNSPIYEDNMLPLGRLRDSPYQLDRAHFVLVTKCPDGISPLDMRIVSKNLDLRPYQHLYFTRFISSEPQPLFADLDNVAITRGTPVIVMTGIANPRNFIEHVEDNYTLVHKMVFGDHYAFKMRDIYRLEELLHSAPENTAVMVTEKDAVKLLGSKKISNDIKRRLYYISITLEFLEGCEVDFMRQLGEYVRENQRYNIVHPQ